MIHTERKSFMLALAILMCLLLIVSACDSGSDSVLVGTSGEDLPGEGDDENVDGDEDEDSDEGDDEGDEDVCDGGASIDAVDHVVVPAGEMCTLLGTQVIGDVIVGTSASLIADGVSVGGSIEALGAQSVAIVGGSFIAQSVVLLQGGDAKILDSQIDADLNLTGNSGALEASGNMIGGNMPVTANTGGVLLNSNQIGMILKCVENDPAPTGSGNTALEKQGQCADL